MNAASKQSLRVIWQYLAHCYRLYRYRYPFLPGFKTGTGGRLR